MVKCIAKTDKDLQCEREATYKLGKFYYCWQHAEALYSVDEEQDMDFEPVFKTQEKAKKRFVFQRQAAKQSKELLSSYQDFANGCFKLTQGMAKLLKDKAIVDFGIAPNKKHGFATVIFRQYPTLIPELTKCFTIKQPKPVIYVGNTFSNEDDKFQLLKHIPNISTFCWNFIDLTHLNRLLKIPNPSKLPLVMSVVIPGHTFVCIYFFDTNHIEIFDPSGLLGYHLFFAEIIRTHLFYNLGLKNIPSVFSLSENIQTASDVDMDWQIKDTFCQTWIWWYIYLRLYLQCDVIKALHDLKKLKQSYRHTVFYHFWTWLVNEEHSKNLLKLVDCHKISMTDMYIKIVDQSEVLYFDNSDNEFFIYDYYDKQMMTSNSKG